MTDLQKQDQCSSFLKPENKCIYKRKCWERQFYREGQTLIHLGSQKHSFKPPDENNFTACVDCITPTPKLSPLKIVTDSFLFQKSLLWWHPFLSNKVNADELNVVFNGIFAARRLTPGFALFWGNVREFFVLFQERLEEKGSLWGSDAWSSLYLLAQGAALLWGEGEIKASANVIPFSLHKVKSLLCKERSFSLSQSGLQFQHPVLRHRRNFHSLRLLFGVRQLNHNLFLPEYILQLKKQTVQSSYSDKVSLKICPDHYLVSENGQQQRFCK